MRFVPTRAAFARAGPRCRQVPRCLRSYSALRLPVSLRPTLRFRLCSAYLGVEACSAPASRAPTYERRVGALFFGAPFSDFSEENPGPPRLLGRPLRTCRGHLPRRLERPPRPLAVTSLLPSGPPRPWAEPEFPFRWLAHHGPRVRLPTHQRSRYRERCKAGYRPAGLSFGRAGFAPAGRLFRISRRHRLTSYPYGPAGPGRIRRRGSRK